MRTDEEILKRIEEREDDDLLGIERADLIFRLPFEKAKPFLKPDAPADKWKIASRQREDLLAEMLDYMPFAWEKANNCRGLSVWRAMSHYMSWTWLAGDDFGELFSYPYYGKDDLRRICEHYGWDADQWDNGIRTDTILKKDEKMTEVVEHTELSLRKKKALKVFNESITNFLYSDRRVDHELPSDSIEQLIYTRELSIGELETILRERLTEAVVNYMGG